MSAISIPITITVGENTIHLISGQIVLVTDNVTGGSNITYNSYGATLKTVHAEETASQISTLSLMLIQVTTTKGAVNFINPTYILDYTDLITHRQIQFYNFGAVLTPIEVVDTAAAITSAINTIANAGGAIPTNPIDFYLDSAADLGGDGSIDKPFKLITELVAYVDYLANPTQNYTASVAPSSTGYGGEVVGSLVFPTNLSLIGKTPQNTGIGCNVTFTAPTGANVVTQYRNVALNGEWTLDLSLASFSSVVFNNGAFGLNRIDTNPNGFVSLGGGVFGAEINGGSLLMEGALMFGDINIYNNAMVYAVDTLLFDFGGGPPKFNLNDTATLKTLNVLNPTAGFVTGTDVAQNWFTDAASNETYGGTLTKTVYGGGASGLATSGENYYIVETGNDEAVNASALTTAYTLAGALTPGGNPLSTTNRATVLLMPGKYDFTASNFNVNQEFVDIVGFSGNASDTVIYSNSSTQNTIDISVSDIQVKNITVEKTDAVANYKNAISITSVSTSAHVIDNINVNADVNSIDMFHNPDVSGKYSNIKSVGENCALFFSQTGSITSSARFENIFVDAQIGNNAMAAAVNNAGRFINCHTTSLANDNGFTTPNISGRFENCSSTSSNTNLSFGNNISNINTDAVFINCKTKSTGGQNRSFAGNGGTCNGTFVNCQTEALTINKSFAGGSAGGTGTCGGTFNNCSVSGATCYGFGGGCLSSGTFVNCTSNATTYDASFGGENGVGSTGRYVGCVATSGGEQWSFGGLTVASGYYENCKTTNASNLNNSFGGYGGVASGTFINCSADDGKPFGGDNASPGTGTANGYFESIKMVGTWSTTFSGVLKNSKISAISNIDSAAEISYCTILGTSNTAGGPSTPKMSYCGLSAIPANGLTNSLTSGVTGTDTFGGFCFIDAAL